jgi:hypothetical protein
MRDSFLYIKTKNCQTSVLCEVWKRNRVNDQPDKNCMIHEGVVKEKRTPIFAIQEAVRVQIMKKKRTKTA